MNFFTGTDDGFTFVNSVFDTDNFRLRTSLKQIIFDCFIFCVLFNK